jgi:hypothetical protein
VLRQHGAGERVYLALSHDLEAAGALQAQLQAADAAEQAE